MSYRPRGIIAMMTLAGTLAGLSREDRSNPMKVNTMIHNRELHNGHDGMGHRNKAFAKQLQQRRTRNKMARKSRRINRDRA